jgi:hypothetical protein
MSSPNSCREPETYRAEPRSLLKRVV